MIQFSLAALSESHLSCIFAEFPTRLPDRFMERRGSLECSYSACEFKERTTFSTDCVGIHCSTVKRHPVTVIHGPCCKCQLLEQGKPARHNNNERKQTLCNVHTATQKPIYSWFFFSVSGHLTGGWREEANSRNSTGQRPASLLARCYKRCLKDATVVVTTLYKG